LIKKINIFFLLFIFSLINNLYATEKESIIQKLKQTKSIKFKFTQKINEDSETGICMLMFPQKLNCKYNDDKQKELIINKDTLVIIQRRYDKKYYYPISESIFSKILVKEKFIKFIDISEVNINQKEIELINSTSESQNIILIFNLNTYDLMGWRVKDKFNNNVEFLITTLSTNEKFGEDEFKIPILD